MSTHTPAFIISALIHLGLLGLVLTGVAQLPRERVTESRLAVSLEMFQPPPPLPELEPETVVEAEPEPEIVEPAPPPPKPEPKPKPKPRPKPEPKPKPKPSPNPPPRGTTHRGGRTYPCPGRTRDRSGADPTPGRGV